MSQPQRSGPPLPFHTEKEIAQSKAIAREFYAADSQLDKSDREQLARMFGNRLTLFPVAGVPIIFAGIMAPNWLKKAGFIPKNKPTRGLQVILGLTGVLVGFGFSQKVAKSWQDSKLADKPASQQAYRIISQYPPQLGSRYYSLTARSPQLALKDPDTIDWSRELAFPLMLVMRQPRPGEYPTPWAPGPIGGGSQGPQGSQGPNQNNIEAPRSNGWTINQSQERIPPSLGSPGNTWDKVRRESMGIDDQARSSPSPSSFPPPVASSNRPVAVAPSSQPVPAVKSWDEDPIDVRDRNAAQKEFDQLMDRERHGEEGVNDDFSKSEEKWS